MPNDVSIIESKTTLFFIKNESHNFTVVENFLKKRDYIVIVETDIKKAVNHLTQINPQYIFLAWDHKNESIRTLPKIIQKKMTAQIVPFIMSTQRDQLIQLETSGFENKLYPPLSGPAILRILQKQEKQNQAFNTIQNKSDATNKKSEMFQVKSSRTETNENSLVSHKSANPEADNTDYTFSSKKSQIRPQSAAQQVAMSEEQRQKLALNHRAKLKMYVPDDEFEPSALLVPTDTKNLSQGQIHNLEESFTEKIRPEIFDMLETQADQENAFSPLHETTEIYVMLVQEPEWCGYLIVGSENDFDIDSAQIILAKWINTIIKVDSISEASTDETSSEQNTPLTSMLFKINIPKIDFTNFCSYQADFYKEIEHKSKKTTVGFFAFSPFLVFNAVHPQHDYLQIPTSILKPSDEMTFNLYLYLPENKKFILYIHPHSSLNQEQINRLISRDVNLTYVSLEHEQALIQYRAEHNIKSLIKNYLKTINVST